MPLEDYPSNLPEPVREGFSFVDKIKETAITTGAGDTRLREWGQGDVSVIKATFKFGTIEQENDFIEFLKYTINYGQDWFNADWFQGWGFAASTYAFKFLGMQERKTGWSGIYTYDILMQPRANAPEPAAAWTESKVNPSYVERRYGCISPASAVVSGTTTTVTLGTGVAASDRWRVGWKFVIYDLLDLSRVEGVFTIDQINGDVITFSPAASVAPDDTRGIMFADYDEVVDSQKGYAFLSDDGNNFVSDGGAPYELTYGDLP